MKFNSRDMLRRLGSGESIQSVSDAADISRQEFDTWWADEAKARVPKPTGSMAATVSTSATIERDAWGIPHIYAETDDDLFFAFGYAMAQDRLFQLDYLRRKAMGRLSEVMGEDGLHLDTIARTLGLNRIARAEWESIPEETGRLLRRFSDGINALIEQSRGNLPIEFDLLDYQPDPWSPVDCLAIAGEFRYYLTVRFPVIVIPELAKRTLGEGPLYRAFMQGEADDESILPPGSYPSSQEGLQPVGAAVGDPDEGQGSNNWVVSGARTTTGRPIVASDPHIAFAAVSCWYEVHLSGGSFNTTGMAYVGMPAVMFGRNEHVAWGITNNICSQRDLYQEKTDSAHPGSFLFDGRWEPEGRLTETIEVRGGKTVQKTIRFSRNGPIVDEILPPQAKGTGPVSLRWLGATECGWLTSLLNVDRARSIDEFREAVRPWRVPTWSMVVADSEGHIGYQSVGAIPVRTVWERGYRPGWEPEHQWKGIIPFDQMPRLQDPDRGWIATANNRVAPDDFQYPLSGTWASGHRARRVRQMIEERKVLSRGAVGEMHQDTKTLRGEDGVPGLLAALDFPALDGNEEERITRAAEHLAIWDRRMDKESVGATIFEVFFAVWSRRLVEERFPSDLVGMMTGAAGGLAAALLYEDAVGWFQKGNREEAIRESLNRALDQITDRLGPDMSQWQWGALHKIHLRHVLSQRGDLGKLLDRGGLPVSGNGVTVCNTGFDPNWGAYMGANYRLIADMSENGLRAVDSQGQSGHPGSDHYCDQLKEWIAGRYHFLPLDRSEATSGAKSTLTLTPS